MRKPTDKQWNDFVTNFVDSESDVSNVKGTFSTISRTQAVPYYEFLKAQWICSRDHMTEEEFCKMNGDVPKKFFDGNIKDRDQEFEITIKE